MKKHVLFMFQWIDIQKSEHFFISESFVLPEKARKKLFSEFNLDFYKKLAEADLKPHASFTTYVLFYYEQEAIQIATFFIHFTYKDFKELHSI